MADIKKTEQPKLSRWQTGLLSVIAIVAIGFPISIVVRERLSWNDTTSVVGVVVETLPANASIPEFVVFEYLLPDEKKAKATVGINFTTAHQIGAEQELVYRANSPERALTRLAAREQLIGNYTPFGLFASLFTGLLALAIAFPKLLRPSRIFRF